MERFKKYNTLIGEVIGCNKFGCYVRDKETDRVVFYYGCGQKGDVVQLTVKRVDREKEWITCLLDSVLSYAA